MRDTIARLVVEYVNDSDQVMKMTDELCELFNVEIPDDEYVMLAKSTYLHKDGTIHTACYRLAGSKKLYYTHKNNLF